MGRNLYRHSFQKKSKADGQQAHEKILNILNHQGNVNKNHEISPCTC